MPHPLPHHEPFGEVADHLLVDSLKKLKEKLAVQRRNLDEIDGHIQELEKERSGETQ